MVINKDIKNTEKNLFTSLLILIAFYILVVIYFLWRHNADSTETSISTFLAPDIAAYIFLVLPFIGTVVISVFMTILCILKGGSKVFRFKTIILILISITLLACLPLLFIK